MCSTLSRDSCALGEAFFQNEAAKTNTKQRRFERRAHLHWEGQHAAEDVAARSRELSLRQQTCYPSGECGSSDLARAAASRRSTFHYPFELGLTEAERACIAVRNTFLDIRQPKEELHRRRSAPVVASLEDKGASELFLQPSEKRLDADVETASFCSTDSWHSLNLQASDGMPS